MQVLGGRHSHGRDLFLWCAASCPDLTFRNWSKENPSKRQGRQTFTLLMINQQKDVELINQDTMLLRKGLPQPSLMEIPTAGDLGLDP